MMKYLCRTHLGEVQVCLHANEPNQPGALEVSGPDRAVAMVQRWLRSATGAFGHMLGDTPTPVDLHCAFLSVQGRGFLPELQEGGELVVDYSSSVRGRNRVCS